MSKIATYFKTSSVHETTSYFKHTLGDRKMGEGRREAGRDTHTKANFLNDNILHRLIMSIT